MHAGGIEIAEPRRIGPVLAVDEVERSVEELLVHRLHARGVERAGVFDGLLADPAVGRINGWIVAIARLALENSARPELRAETLFLRIKVVEVAEEFVEAVHGRQELIAVAKMVLAELSGGVAERLERFRHTHVLNAQANVRPRQSDLGEAGA